MLSLWIPYSIALQSSLSVVVFEAYSISDCIVLLSSITLVSSWGRQLL